VLSGDVFYLQEQLYAASYAMSFTNGAAINQNYGRGPTGAEGGVSGSDPRAMAWAIRAAVMASYIAPDGWPEKTYFDQLITDFVAIEEGARCGSGDILPWCASSPRRGLATWVWGYTYRKLVNGALGYPPLGQWYLGSSAFVQGSPSGGSYGINMAAGAGTASNGGLSATINLSDSGACASVPVGTVIEVCSSSSYSSGNQFTVASKSCPSTLTLSAAINASSCTHWMYSPTVASATSQFSMDYMMYSWGRAVEMGYPLGNLFNTLAGYYAGLLTTSDVNPRLGFSGRTPTLSSLTGAYFPTFTDLAQGWHSTWRDFTTGFHPFGGNGPPVGYAARLYGATSFLPASSATNAVAAWQWVKDTVRDDVGWLNDPVWALVERAESSPPPDPTPPTISSTSPLPGGTVGAVYTFQFGAAGATPISWSATGVPAGLSLSAGGLLSGTPAGAGVSTIHVTASNGTLPDAEGDFSLTVSAAPVPGVVVKRGVTLGGKTIQ
jgi:hypothetical protein